LRCGPFGSTAKTVSAGGATAGEQRYMPFGLDRYTTGSLNTAYRFNGQRIEDNTDLYFYQSRWYDPVVGRFIQPDSIVPNPGNPQSLSRYTYVQNNPLRYIDPTGHWAETLLDIAFLAYDIDQILQEGWTTENTLALVADIACTVIPGGTGGGPGLRLAYAGGHGGVTVATRASVHADDVARMSQAFAKGLQAGDALDDAQSDSSSSGRSQPDTPTSPEGLTGHDFERWLADETGGTGPFKVDGSEFDNAVGDRWMEAKSGGYWDLAQRDASVMHKFKSSMGRYKSIAEKYGKTFELHTNSPIPDFLRQWLSDQGISWTEYLGG
jgi:RHS repeat-associated protein